MSPSRRDGAARAGACLLAVAGIVAGAMTGAMTGAGAVAAGELAPIAPPAAGAAADGGVRPLRLEVLVRGASTHLVEPFDLLPDGRLLARRADLEEAGIGVPGARDPRARIDLDALPRVRHHYDPAQQTIDFDLPDADRVARSYDAAALRGTIGPEASAAPSDWGVAANYALYGTTVDRLRSFPRFAGANATLDARAFGPYGTLGQTAVIGDTVATRRDALRLDTTYRYSDVEHMVTGEVGDVVGGGLPWTRPFRFAGVQVGRDFGTRPDLVVQPLPNLSGSAAVPSTVDVFVNGVKAYSQNVAAGPYAISNLPVVSGDGTARVLVTDASGRQTETALPFFSTPGLLAPGTTDFSAGAGFARRGYGLASDGYGSRPLGTATARRGLTDWLTAEGHAEGGAGLAEAGVGAEARAGAFGTVSGALAGSRYGGASGAQLYLGYGLDLFGASLSAASQRTFGPYADVGSVTAGAGAAGAAGAAAVRYAAGVYTLDARPPRALDRLTLGVPLGFDPASVGVSLVDLVEAGGARSRIVSLSLTRPLPHETSLFATGYADVARRNSAGLFVGLSMPLGGRVRASLGGTSSSAGRTFDVEIGQPLGEAEGSLGWRVRDVEGGGSGIRGGGASYRSGYGTLAADVSQNGGQNDGRSGGQSGGQSGGTVSGRGALDGSVGYVAGGGFFAGRRASDGFAVVDAGAPGVPILQDNRVVGTTDRWGKLLVSDMRPYAANSVALDPSALPGNSEAAATHRTVVPPAHGGLGVTFGVDRAVDAALVTFVTADGRPVRAGARGRAVGEGSGGDAADGFVLGYDGQAYLRHLKPGNAVLIDLGEADCRADFRYDRTADRTADRPPGSRPVRLGPVTCR